jgi:toxin YoeB
MEIAFTDEAKDDLLYWKNTNNSKHQERIKQLILAIQQHPFKGIGKPEPLKHTFAGLWSRRIDREHRIIYEVTSARITVHSLRGHYKRK